MTSRTLWLTTLGTTALAIAVTSTLTPRLTASVADGAPVAAVPDRLSLVASAAMLEQPDGNGGPAGGGADRSGGAPENRGGMDNRGGRGGPDDGPPMLDSIPGPGGMRHGGMERGGPDRGGLERGGMERGGPMDRDPGRFRQPSADMMGRYIDLVQRYGEISKDPSLAGVSAVITANDLLRSKGTPAGIDYFKRLLPEVKDPTVQRAIRLMLIDLYRRAQQNDAALVELESLIRNTPTTAPTTMATR